LADPRIETVLKKSHQRCPKKFFFVDLPRTSSYITWQWQPQMGRHLKESSFRP